MKIRLAQSSGFCMGVRRAVEMALEAVHRVQGPIYAYGPLIHNPQATGLLESKGMQTLKAQPEALHGLPPGTVIIRAHGIPPQERKAIADLGFKIIDATCPRVIRVQAIISKHTAKGFEAIIWGNPNHPEVVGLVGHAQGHGHVIESFEDLEQLPDFHQVILAAQTTQDIRKFEAIVAAVRARWPEALVFETICGATQRRQDDVRKLAGEVRAMVVVGGHSSGNTMRLAEVAESQGAKTIRIETEDELDPAMFKGVESVGVTAGASTPNWMIKRVLRWLERYERHGELSAGVLARRILRAVVLSNLYAALGAASLCLAGALLQNLQPRLLDFGITFFYVHAMHMLNLFLDKEASQFNDPDRVHFLEKYRVGLLSSGIFSAVVSLALSLVSGPLVLFFLFFMNTLGLLYAVPLVPRSLTPYTRFRRLKEIPASKTVSLAGGWAFCLTLVPVLSPAGHFSWGALVVMGVIFIMVFVRSALSDVMDVQGDRIAGRETIPIIFGVQRTLTLLLFGNILLVFLLVAGWAFGLLTSLALPLILCAGYLAGFVMLFRGERIMGSGLFEAIIDANFILAGLIAWIWAAW